LGVSISVSRCWIVSSGAQLAVKSLEGITRSSALYLAEVADDMARLHRIASDLGA
jgi:hypothetical protein